MATVYLAEDERLGRKVAVKRLHSDSPEDAAQRFEREAKVGASLSHPNLVTVFDTVADDEGVLIVMEYVAGENLAELMARERVPSEQAVSIIRQVAGALDHAHQAGVVHRDVKPANILLRHDDLVKLTDFGIARALDAVGHTRAGEMLGTPNYISPEQALGKPATGASDLYSLGVVAHEALTGRRPFHAQTPVATALSHIHEPPPPLPETVPEMLAGVVEDLLEKDPADRPPNARAVAVRLGLHDHELMGLSLGLAEAVYGDSEPAAPVGDSNPREAQLAALRQAHSHVATLSVRDSS
jgi:serine/threonine-protein kinase